MEFVFLGWSFLSIFWAGSKFLAVGQLLILIEAAVLAWAIVWLLRKKILPWEWFAGLIVAAAVLESLIGFLQVIFQGSLGLYLLGEPRLNLLDPTIAKTIVSGGGRLLRAYGTFPHPNVLGAFLLVSLIVLLSSRAKPYFLKKYGWAWRSLDYRDCFASPRTMRAGALRYGASFAMTVALFTILLGLILTFSRAAWLVGGLIFLIFIFHNLFAKSKHWPIGQCLDWLMTVVVIVVVVVGIFHWAVFPKLFFSLTEPAISLRIKYLKIGWEILKERPLLGAGVGNQVAYAVKNNLYQKEGIVRELDYQPAHNIYLLIASELGIIGLVLFLFFIFLLLKKIFLDKKLLSCAIAQDGNVGLICLSLLMLGLADHFLWTLPFGQLMFWTVAFLASAYSSTDRAHPSEG